MRNVAHQNSGRQEYLDTLKCIAADPRKAFYEERLVSPGKGALKSITDQSGVPLKMLHT